MIAKKKNSWRIEKVCSLIMNYDCRQLNGCTLHSAQPRQGMELNRKLIGGGGEHGPLIDMIISIYLHCTRPEYKLNFGNFFHGPTSWCSKPDPRFVVCVFSGVFLFF